jgi:hypothetical protein
VRFLVSGSEDLVRRYLGHVHVGSVTVEALP